MIYQYDKQLTIVVGCIFSFRNDNSHAIIQKLGTREMVTELNLFPPEDTLIRCKIPNSDKVIEVDAMEIDAMVGEAYARKQVSSMTVYELVNEVVDIFNTKYGYKMSHRSMDLLIMTKDKILTELKKNTLG